MHAANFATDSGSYYAHANDEILVVVMIEHVESIQNLDAILSVPGIDVAFIGPNDLHASMGRPPAFESEDPQFLDAVQRVLSLSKKHGVAPGIHVVDAAAAQRRLSQGFQFVAVASEAGFMMAKTQEVIRTLGLGAGSNSAKY